LVGVPGPGKLAVPDGWVAPLIAVGVAVGVGMLVSSAVFVG
jgi:hypothetical protein